MADSEAQLNDLDRLIADLSHCLAQKDWEAMATLNARVKPAVEPLMVALEAGQLEAEVLRLRLDRLQQFVEAADAGARQARLEAENQLKGVSQNRSAAKAYQNVSSNQPK